MYCSHLHFFDKRTWVLDNIAMSISHDTLGFFLDRCLVCIVCFHRTTISSHVRCYSLLVMVMCVGNIISMHIVSIGGRGHSCGWLLGFRCIMFERIPQMGLLIFQHLKIRRKGLYSAYINEYAYILTHVYARRLIETNVHASCRRCKIAFALKSNAPLPYVSSDIFGLFICEHSMRSEYSVCIRTYMLT